MENSINLNDFLNKYGKSIKEKVRSKLTPIFQADRLDFWDKKALDKLANLSRLPFQAQASTILSVAKGLYVADKKSAILCGEMGSGKTLMGIGVASLIPKKACRVVIMCPSHLVQKWQREILDTDSYAKVKILKSISDVDLNKPKQREYWIISKERAKLHYSKKFSTPATKRKGQICIKCCRVLGDEDVFKCGACGEPLYSADSSKFRRYAVAEYIKRHKKYCKVDLLIADELHELKSGETAQGQAFHALIVSSKKCLGLTGTLMGGYSSNLYHLLFRMFTKKMVGLGYKHNSSTDFSRCYGVVEEVIEVMATNSRTASMGDNKSTRRVQEKPGISPLLLPHFLLENSVYLWVSDISDKLPSYEEEIELVEMADEQSIIYKQFERELVAEVKDALSRKDHRLLGALVNSLYALPDGARRGEIVLDPNYKEAEVTLCSADALDIAILPKEERLLQIVNEERRQGRKCAIFLERTGTRDLICDLVERLEANGVKALVLRSNTVETSKREAYLKRKVLEDRPDVLICNPNLVKTGLDLLDFPTIIYFQTGMSIYTLRQSSRRSWRIGQKRDVKVYYMAYAETAQARALKLIATKLETSNAVEGKLSADGLSAMSEGDASMVIALARSIMGEDEDRRSLKAAWQGYKKSEQTKDKKLSDDEVAPILELKKLQILPRVSDVANEQADNVEGQNLKRLSVAMFESVAKSVQVGKVTYAFDLSDLLESVTN